MPAPRIVECVPNFSEGRDRSVIDAIARSISATAGVTLLDVDPGADTNRTVYTFVGEPEAVGEAVLAAAGTARGLIDMARQKGAHPRIGALDVCPFVPVSGLAMADCVELAKRVGERLARELEVPVYLYEHAASRPERRLLADIRAGEYEGLPAKLARPEWAPDFGPARFVPGWGATVVGAREFLIAYNVNLNTRDKRLAGEVATAIREGGRVARDAAGNVLRDERGEALRTPGRLKDVRAIGWYIESYRCAQVSINLVNHRGTPLHAVFEAAKEEAERLGLLVTGSELVGLVPLDAMRAAGRHFLRKMGKSEGASEAELVETAVKSMGLDSIGPFDPAKKIVEYACRGPAPLLSSSLGAFVDEVASDAPAPGGGSVAALAGCLGAALAAMVGNLTAGKKGLEASRAAMSELAVRAQAVKEQLARAVDEDSAAFGEVLAAMRLPKASETERAAREAAIQASYKRAASLPLETARACLEALRLCVEAAKGGLPSSVSDAGVGALVAWAGVEGAAFNVLVNLGSIDDPVFVAERRREAEALIAEAGRARAAAEGVVRDGLR